MHDSRAIKERRLRLNYEMLRKAQLTLAASKVNDFERYDELLPLVDLVDILAYLMEQHLDEAHDALYPDDEG